MSDLSEFLDWCQEKEIKFDGLELRSAGKDAGNGVFATRFFRLEEKLISLPEDLMITAGKVADMDKYAVIIDRNSVLLTPFEMLTLFFCLEDPETSDYGPYLKMLPKDFTTPAYLGGKIDSGDLPASIRDFWINQEADLKEIHEKLHRLVPEITRKKFVWAWHVVNTRCIFVENKPNSRIDSSDGDNLAVIPFVDMLNHSPSAQGFALHDKYSHSYMVKSHKCVAEGDQVFVCYGPHDNARLWMEYGFTMVENPNTKIAISRDLFLALAKKIGVEVTCEHEKAIYEANLPCSLYQSDEGPSWAIRTNLRILLMDPSEITRWRDIVYSERMRRTSSSEEDSSDESQSNEVSDGRTRREMAVLVKMLSELQKNVDSKRDKVAGGIKWIWDEQCSLIQATINAITMPRD